MASVRPSLLDASSHALAAERRTRRGGAPIAYKTLFQDPGTSRTPDLSLESYVIALINATG